MATKKEKNSKKHNKVATKVRSNKYLKYFIYFISSLFVLLALYNLYYSNRVLPGVYVNDSNVSGLTQSELIKKIKAIEPSQDYLIIRLDNSDNEYTVDFDSLGISYDSAITAEKAFYEGRDKFYSHIAYIVGYFKPKANLSLEYSVNEDLLNVELATLAANNFPAYKESSFYYEDETLLIREGGVGRNVDLENLKQDIISSLSSGKVVYTAKTTEFTPLLSVQDLESVKADIQEYIDTGVIVKSGRKNVSVPSEELLKFLLITKDNDSIVIGPNESAIAGYVESLVETFNVSPKALAFSVTGDSIQFEPPVTGIKLDTEKSQILISDNLESFFENREGHTNNIELIVTKSNPSVDSNEYGITELIAQGESHFRGSISSRVSNIVTATNKIKGTLVAPGEEFSFNEAVGPIDVENGFNQAYVISKGRTVLGTGGGVCQVSTTVYRAALNSGLPITERSAHAYRVGYYEQEAAVGLDATIYQPSLDLKFKNDTDNHILVYSEIDTTSAYMAVKIYGTSDGRTVEITEPEMVTQIAPPAPIYEDTNELAKGAIEQVEWPAWGGTVQYSRVVKDKDGNIMYEDTFKNYYTPWPAVYKRGV